MQRVREMELLDLKRSVALKAAIEAEKILASSASASGPVSTSSSTSVKAAAASGSGSASGSPGHKKPTPASARQTAHNFTVG